MLLSENQTQRRNLFEILGDDAADGKTPESAAEPTSCRSEAIPIQRPDRPDRQLPVFTDSNPAPTVFSWPLANQPFPGMDQHGQLSLDQTVGLQHFMSTSWPIGNPTVAPLMIQSLAQRTEHRPLTYYDYRRPRTISLSSTASDVISTTIDDDQSPADATLNGLMSASYAGTEDSNETIPISAAQLITVPDMTDPSQLSVDLVDTPFLPTSDMCSSNDDTTEATKLYPKSVEGIFSAVAPITDSYATHTMPLQEPSISVLHQPPHQYRVRYDKETTGTPKGLLKDQEKEPPTIRLENVPPQAGDIPIEISVRTVTGQPHPTIYATCFGKSMPDDWSQDATTGIVRTVVKATEGYCKRLNYLAVRRHKQESVDVSMFQQQELKSFRVKIEALVPSARGSKVFVSATTRLVQAVCPNKMKKLREQYKHQQEGLPVSPAKKAKS